MKKFLPSFPKPAKKNDEVASLIRFVRARKFSAIEYFLLDKSVNAPHLIRECSKALGEPFLHFILQFDPPVDLVQVVITKMRGHIHDEVIDNSKDDSGRTPLHVAAAHGCDSTVLECLLLGEGGFRATVRDATDRCPLHRLCMNPRGDHKLANGHTGRKDTGTMVKSLEYLLKAYPYATIAKDTNGLIPMELAVLNDADDALVEPLKRTTNDCYEKKESMQVDWVPSQVRRRVAAGKDSISSIGMETSAG